MNNELYPLKFEPILKEKIWGGRKLISYLNKVSDNQQIGESWEVSDVEEDTSIVKNGNLKGKSLRWLLSNYQADLVGNEVYRKFKNQFPLLIKFIDAQENLSVQLHPDDKLAKKQHNSFGKTEMWYIMQADKNCGIITGFKDGVTRDDYTEKLQKDEIEQILNFEEVKPGDVYFIKPGLIHAIGKGVLLAEIQQSSDITYRIYDYNRKDKHGNKRELHTAKAENALDFQPKGNHKINYSTKNNAPLLLVDNEYFKTKYLKLNKEISLDYSKTDSFVIYMNVEGSATISVEGFHETLNMGETLLIPACFNEVKITTNNSTLLEVTI